MTGRTREESERPVPDRIVLKKSSGEPTFTAAPRSDADAPTAAGCHVANVPVPMFGFREPGVGCVFRSSIPVASGPHAVP
jgi:hypothetical protein